MLSHRERSKHQGSLRVFSSEMYFHECKEEAIEETLQKPSEKGTLRHYSGSNLPDEVDVNNSKDEIPVVEEYGSAIQCESYDLMKSKGPSFVSGKPVNLPSLKDLQKSVVPAE